MTALARQLLYLRDIQKRHVRVSTLAAVDQYFEYVDRCFQTSSDTGMAALDKLRFVPKQKLPKDPFSVAYREAQHALYLQIAGRSDYDALTCEQTPFDFEATKNRPFPYSTGSAAQVGDQLLGQGFILKNLGLPAGARIVEFGPGWGNLTLALAQTGYSVTAVEIDAQLCRLLKHRASQVELTVTTAAVDMLSFQASEPFDAAIFYESFHHCLNHMTMLERLRSLIKPDGKVLFAGEPVSIFANPWGVRMDGQSLWAIRKHGWLELGFDRTYFKEALRRTGWNAEYRHADVSHVARIWVATKV